MRAICAAILLGALTAACGTGTNDVVRNDPRAPGTTWKYEVDPDTGGMNDAG